jgi:DNA repair exonuclease SbcCD nuclease subunit
MIVEKFQEDSTYEIYDRSYIKMKILLTSDQHWHVFKDFDRLTKDGKSYRLSLYERTHEFIRAYCDKNKIKHWVDAGDMFHSRESISVPVLDLMGKQLKYNKLSGIKQFFLKGNHDTSNKSGDISSLNILSEYGEVINERSVVDLNLMDGVESYVHFIPWDNNLNFVEEINKVKTNLVIAHRMIEGSHSNKITLDGESLSGLNYSQFDYIFMGHVHEYQKINDKTFYIGSLISNNFNDKDQEKGFLVYDFNTKTFERVMNPYSPKYKVLKAETIEDINKCKELIESDKSGEPNFYDLRVELREGEDLSKLSEIKINNARMTITKKSKDENRIVDANLLTPQMLLEKFKEMNKLDDDIYNVGKEILSEILK